MTFTKLHLQGIRSDEGYEVEFKGRDAIQYRESNGRTITLDAEPILPPFLPEGRKSFDVIYLRHHRAWDPPDSGAILTDADRRLIEERIHAALEFLGEPHEFA